MAQRITKNIVANILGKLWAFVSIYLFVPIYIGLLGIENYGIIIFYAILQTFLTLADNGLSATLNREFAREVSDPDYKRSLLKTFETVYISIAIIIVVFVWFGADYIASTFLKSDSISLDDLVHCVRMMGITIAFYIFATLYQSGLNGLQRQVISNVLSIAYNVVKAGLVIIPLLIWTSVHVYFYWQIVVVVLYCLVLRYYVYRYLGSSKAKIRYGYFKPLWRYILGMIFMALIYAANTQVDKLVVGNLLSLTDFSYYGLASSVGQAALILVSPIGIAFFPELVRSISIRDEQRTTALFHRFAHVISIISATVVMILFYYADPYIAIWQQDSSLAGAIAPTARILLIGYFFLALQLAPYYLALANGHTKTNVVMGILTILLVVPGIAWMAGKYGLWGAAIPWLAVNFIITWMLGFMIIHKFLYGELFVWLWNDCFIPMMITVIISLPLHLILQLLPQGELTLVYGCMLGLIMLYVNGIYFIRRYPEIKNQNKLIAKIYSRI